MTPEIKAFVDQQRLTKLQEEAKKITVSTFKNFHFSIVANDDEFSVDVRGDRLKNVCALADVMSRNIKLKEILKDALILAER